MSMNTRRRAGPPSSVIPRATSAPEAGRIGRPHHRAKPTPRKPTAVQPPVVSCVGPSTALPTLRLAVVVTLPTLPLPPRTHHPVQRR